MTSCTLDGDFQSRLLLREQTAIKKRKKYVRELCDVGHLDFSPASQELHQVEAFVCLEPTGDEEEEEKGGRRRR